VTTIWAGHTSSEALQKLERASVGAFKVTGLAPPDNPGRLPVISLLLYAIANN
jgi:hypothetical protein